MKKHKSKSNIMSNNKETQKLSELVKKQKLKNQLCHKSTVKPSQSTKNVQSKSYYPQKVTNMHAKTKTYLEKMTIVLPHQNLKHQNQNSNSTQRRKSSSAAQRVESRFSKRGSVVSNKSNKDKKYESLKENDKNYLNLQQVYERQNQQIRTTSKKITKNLQNKKKPTSNINPKIKAPHEAYQSQKKNDQKNQNYQKLQNKMSQYLDSKGIFSMKVSKQKSNHSKQSKKSSSQKKKHEKCIKIQDQRSSVKMKNAQRQNLLGIYQFYKKTFDINFNNCFKKGKNMTKIDKSSQNFSKSALKPFYSSIVIDRNQNGSSSNNLNPFFKSINQTKISASGVLNQNQQLAESKRNGSVLIYNKENESKIMLQKSSFINCRSKSNANSDSSTKDNLFYWKSDQENIDINNFDAKKINRKNSFKDLIVFNEKVNNKFAVKEEIPFESCSKSKINEKVQECSEFSKISIGQSNIDVLKWQYAGQKLVEKVQNPLPQSDGKNIQSSRIKIQEKAVIETDQCLSNQKADNNMMIITEAKRSAEQQEQPDISKLIKKQSNQNYIEGLEDLSSISLAKDQKYGITEDPFLNSPNMKRGSHHFDYIDFQF